MGGMLGRVDDPLPDRPAAAALAAPVAAQDEEGAAPAPWYANYKGYWSAQDALLVAARNGDADAVRALLSEPYSYYVDYRYAIDAGCDGFDGRKTALHLAAKGGWVHVEVVCILLEHGATVDARSSHGDTPLHLCCEYGCGDGCDTDAMKAVAPSLLRLTWKTGQGGAFTESSLRKVLLAFLCCARRDTAVAALPLPLLERIVRFVRDEVKICWVFGSIPVHSASRVCTCRATMAALLCEAGADREATDGCHQTPRELARRKGWEEEYVVASCTAAERATDAVRAGDAAGVAAIIARDEFSVNRRLTIADLVGHDEADVTLLHLAAKLGQVEVVETLLGMGADVEARNYEEDTAGDTALHVAAGWFFTGTPESRMGTITALLRHGADPKKKGWCEMDVRELAGCVDDGEEMLEAAWINAGLPPA